MTNKEAIKVLSQIRDVLLASNSWLPSTKNPIKESFGMAINALTAQPLVLTCDGCKHVGTYDSDFPCSGCIRREKDYYEQER